MKNKGYLIAMSLFMFTTIGTTKAENTDVSELQHVLYVEPLTAEMGTTEVTLSIKMKNYYEAMGFSFGVRLPETFSFATTENGDPDARLSTTRTDETHIDFFQSTLQADGSLSIVAYNDDGDGYIDGNDGEIALVRIILPASTTAGEYPISILNPTVSLSTGSSKREIDEVVTTLTITPASEVILDETSTTAPAAAMDVDVRVKRTIKGGEWSTICLPFDMTAEQVTTAFGSDVQLAKFSSWSPVEDDGGAIVGINVGFETVTTIEANVPLIIKTAGDVSEFVVDGVDVNPDEAKLQVGKKSSERGYMYGNYVNGFTVPEENVFLSGGKFYYSVGKTPMMGYRGYFEFKDVLDAYYDVAPSRINIIIDGATTGIELNKVPTGNDRYYNLSGQPVERPTKGLYISNGKKVVVK